MRAETEFRFLFFGFIGWICKSSHVPNPQPKLSYKGTRCNVSNSGPRVIYMYY